MEVKAELINAYDQDCIGCKSKNEDVMLGVKTAQGHFMDVFISNDAALHLMRQLAKALHFNGYDTGEVLIINERMRQIKHEGWTADHDDQHSDGALSKAAIVYAMDADTREVELENGYSLQGYFWPFDEEWLKPKDRLKDLERAGALISAEMDREIRSRKNG